MLKISRYKLENYNRNSKRFKDWLVIASLCIFYALNNYAWLRLNQCPPVDDEAYHLEASLTCYDILTDTTQNFFIKIKELFNYSVIGFYPPLFHVVAAINNLLFGRELIVSVTTNFFFIAVTFAGLYLIGRKIQDRRLGLLSVFIFAMYPIIFWLSRVFLIETALCAAVVMTMACLIYVGNFSNRMYSILCGFLIGIGMLIKQVFIFYVVGPLAFIIIKSFITPNNKIHKIRILPNLMLTFSIAISLIGLWYLPKIKSLWPAYIKVGYHDIGYASLFSLSSIGFYINILVFQQLLPCFAILFFLSLTSFILGKNKYRGFLIVWIVVPWIIFTLIRTKTIYQTTAVLPAVALISAEGLLSLKSRFLRISSISFLVIFGLWQYFTISYGDESALIRDIKITNRIHYKINLISGNLKGKMRPYAQRGNWQVNDIFSLIESSRSKNTETKILVTHVDGNFLAENRIPWRDDNSVCNKDMFEYMVHFKQLPYKILNFYDRKYSRENYRNLSEVDFIVSVTEVGDLGIEIPGRYDLAGVFTMPDKSTVYIYKNRLIRNETFLGIK